MTLHIPLEWLTYAGVFITGAGAALMFGYLRFTDLSEWRFRDYAAVTALSLLWPVTLLIANAIAMYFWCKDWRKGGAT